MTAGRAPEYPFPESKVIQREVVLKAAPVCPKNIVSSRPEDGSLPDLVPSLQVPKPTALSEVADQVYDTILREEVCHPLAPQDPCFVEFHVQVPEDNGVPEALQGLLQARKVLQRRRR